MVKSKADMRPQRGLTGQTGVYMLAVMYLEPTLEVEQRVDLPVLPEQNIPDGTPGRGLHRGAGKLACVGMRAGAQLAGGHAVLARFGAVMTSRPGRFRLRESSVTSKKAVSSAMVLTRGFNVIDGGKTMSGSRRSVVTRNNPLQPRLRTWTAI